MLERPETSCPRRALRHVGNFIRQVAIRTYAALLTGVVRDQVNDDEGEDA